MTQTIEIVVPDIGEFSEVEVIEVAIEPGDRVAAEDTLITLESDKATMDVPTPTDGIVKSIHLAPGDKVSQGHVIVELEHEEKASPAIKSPPSVSANSVTDDQASEDAIHAQVVVLGAGPGGYSAAFRAADLGLDTVLVERYPTLGGVCLNVGCIPSKALLHTADVMMQIQAMATHGVTYGDAQIDLSRLRDWKESIVGKLTKGLSGLAKQRNVRIVNGIGQFLSTNKLSVDTEAGLRTIHFDKAIIAAGSHATQIAAFPNDDPRLMDSTDALSLQSIPGRLLIIGGGIIGLEIAAVYHALGSKITVVELLDGLIPGCDRDLIRPLQQHIEKRYENIYLSTKVNAIESQADGLKVYLEGKGAPASDVFDRVLVAVGRRPNGANIGADKADIKVNGRGFIPVDSQQRTNVENIFAIGDIVSQPMLAHKATHEGKVAAEVCSGMKSTFVASTIPSVAYTDPEVAWTGVSESAAKEQGIEFKKGVFPWAASGRALGIGRAEGLTKLLFDKDTGRVIGVGIVGPHAGDLIAEATLGIEMGADAKDLGLTIHPHPTLSETINFAAEIVEGTITDLYVPKKS